jgi:hypothetical protein
MKKIISMVILIVSTFEGFSKCVSSALYFWPNKDVISQNSIFVIDGFGNGQEIVNGLGTVHKVYLKSSNEKIKLNVQEIFVGQMYLTQAVLKPEASLSFGQEYELIIENLGDLEKQVFRYNPLTHQEEKIKWKVTSNPDFTPPIWIKKPEFKNAEYRREGCGPMAFANFIFAASDHSEFLIRTTMKNLLTGNETTYYLNSEYDVIAVGHDMCSGAFTFYPCDRFTIEFSLIDASGNLTKWTGERIEFIGPNLKNP